MSKTTHIILTAIAQRHLGIETIKTRNADALDFHDVSASQIADALKAAYDAGRSAANHARKATP